MRWGVVLASGFLACCIAQQASVVAGAQDEGPRVAVGSTGLVTTRTGAADGASSPALTGERRPLYRIHRSDVVEIHFTFSPELDQSVTVQPDGFLALRGVKPVYAEGNTLVQLQQAVVSAYADQLRDPEITVVLKDFDHPYFVVSGQVVHPGKYELRNETTVTEALAIAGGFNDQAKHSQVVVFRHISSELVESRVLNAGKLMASRDLSEDVRLQPGDLVFVPQSAFSKIRRFLPTSNLSLYLNPLQF